MGRGGSSQGWGGGSEGRWGQSESQQQRGRAPKGWKRSDDRIKDDICETLEYRTNINAEDIDIQVKDGEVTLSGTVRSRQEKRQIEDTVEQAMGVKEVHNQLRVKKDSDQGSQQGQHAQGSSGSMGQSSSSMGESGQQSSSSRTSGSSGKSTT
jgi:hypothetical protein